jgi:SM-20-related protein
MSLLDLDALRTTPLKTQPYDYLVVPNFVPADALGRVIGDFPRIDSTGSLPLSELDAGGTFAALIGEMDGPAFRDLIESKFGIALARRPTMFTVRGRCHRGDGKIHTDTGTKIITVLLYLNQAWESDGGRLRILRSPALDDAAEEVSPTGGTLLVFRRSERSWHGHQPFEGPRRAIQMNWVTDESVVAYEQRRHKVSAFFKRLNPFRGAA